MQRQRRFMLTVEISKRLSEKGRKKFYYEAATGRVRGVTKSPSGFGFTVTRAGFEKWIVEHPECATQPAEQVSPVVAAPSAAKQSRSAESLRDESSPKEKSDERSSVRACPA